MIDKKAQPSKHVIVWTHLIRFLMYNLIGALLPLILSLLVRKLSNISAAPGVYAPEILFFPVMIGATALGDITDEVKIVGNGPTFQLIKGALLFGVIGVAAVYGMYQYDNIVGPGNTEFRENIFEITSFFGIILFVVSLAAEYFVAKIREVV